MAYFVAKEGLSFRKYPQLSKLQSKNNIGLGKNYFADVACQSSILSIGKTLKNNMKELLKTFHFVSVLSDGSTDSGLVKQGLFNIYKMICKKLILQESDSQIKWKLKDC